MKVSVAMATYNGARFIEEQLSSIINQTRKVDEIIICDDCSSDKTKEIVNEIINKHSDISFTFIINEQNIGHTANFQKAQNLCTGDIIFFSDQDDVWLQNKVETILNYFSENPDKQVVFTNANIIDKDGVVNKSVTMWDACGFTEKVIKQFKNKFALEVFLARNRATGATMAIKKEFAFNFADCCNEKLFHDGAIAIKALLQNKLGYINECLIKYRIHDSNVIGANSKSIVCDMYQLRTACINFKRIPMTNKQLQRLDFFCIRSNKSKRAIFQLYKYFKFYGLYCFNFWGSDILNMFVCKYKSTFLKE